LIEFTYDSNGNAVVGRYDQMSVVDGGEPGVGDKVKRTAGINPATFNCDAPFGDPVYSYEGGNIQVHYRD